MISSLLLPQYGDKAYSSSVTHAIRCHDAETHLQEHRDLVPPSHRDVGEAMDLPQVLALHSRKSLQSAYQEQCPSWCALGLAIKISFETSKIELQVQINLLAQER